MSHRGQSYLKTIKASLPEASNTAFTMYRRLKRRLCEAPFLAPHSSYIDPQEVTITAMPPIPISGQCPALPPSPGNLCVPPAGNQVCHYDGGQGGTSKDSPLIVTCCCGRCPDDVTCAPDSITGSGLWQSIAYSPLCPTEGCGTDGK